MNTIVNFTSSSVGCDKSKTRLSYTLIVCVVEGKNGMGKVYSSREVIQLLKTGGWYEVRITGSHHHFRHRQKVGIVTIPHPKKQIGKGLWNSILKQAQLKEIK